MDLDPQRMRESAAGSIPKITKGLPFPIVLVALFQFLKAGLLLFLAYTFTGYGAAFTTNDMTVFGLVIFCGAMALLGGGALYFAAIGVKLLRLEKSARRTLMWNILAGWLLFGVSFNGLFFGEGPFIDSWKGRSLICVLVLDVFLYCCLVFYPGVAEAFGEQGDADIFP